MLVNNEVSCLLLHKFLKLNHLEQNYYDLLKCIRCLVLPEICTCTTSRGNLVDRVLEMNLGRYSYKGTENVFFSFNINRFLIVSEHIHKKVFLNISIMEIHL